jgi:myo-inositol catabolism protein IolC
LEARVTGERVYMLAADHRWQWEAWCREADVPFERIREVKSLIVDAFLAAREESGEVRQYGSLLLDLVYGSAQVERALALRIPVATPAEKAGVFPLEWGFDRFEEALPGNCAKVLIRYRPEWAEEVREAQFERLRVLQDWCARQSITYLIEIIVMREQESEHEFETTGRPRIIADLIRASYARGIAPALWKLEGTADAAGAALIDEAIRERPECRQIILGKAADAATIAGWFDAAAAMPSAIGFAIGRSVSWQPGTRYLLGQMSGADATAEIAGGYLGLVDGWRQRIVTV